MGDIYLAQMQFDHVVVTPAPQPDGMGGAIGTGGLVLLIASDVNLGNISRFALFGGVLPHAYGPGGIHVEWRAFYAAAYQSYVTPIDGPDPFTWTQFTTGTTQLNDADGQNGAGYFPGGTLAIRKDESGDVLTFETPIGNMVQTLSGQNGGIALNSTPLYPSGRGQQGSTSMGGLDWSESHQLYNFLALKNGVPFFGYLLSAADPGPFSPVDVTLIPPVANDQLVDRYLQAMADPGGAFGPVGFIDEWQTLGTFPRDELSVDMDQAPEHGILWRVGPSGYDGTAVWVERSFDGARSWQLIVAFDDPSTYNTSPSINWFAGRLTAVWHDGSNIRQAVSLDGGFTWPVPVTFPYAGTNPRHVIDKQGGVGLYFFIDSMGALFVARSFDGGVSFVDAAPRLVVAGIGPQQIDADFAPDGSAVVTYFNLGIWTQLRSRDLGRTWS